MLFYTILNQLVCSVAITLNEPKEKISVEMVFCSLYYVASSVGRVDNSDATTYLAERAKLFGLVKTIRKRHREREQISQQIWDVIPINDRASSPFIYQ